MKGYAPGWVVRCPKCGQSKPAADVGMIRIGAYSVGKRMLGFCRTCNWLRWLIVEKEEEGSRGFS